MATPLVRAIRKDAPQARLDFYSTMPWAVAGVAGVGEQIEMSEKSLDEISDRYEAIHYLCYEHALGLHSVDGYCASTGVLTDDKTPTYVVADEERELARRLVTAQGGMGRRLIGVQAGGRDSHRTCPLSRVQALIDLIAKRLPDVAVVALAAELLVLHNCINLCGAIRRARIAAAVVSLCDYYVTTDSGFMHVAQALSIPTVAIFGATLPELRVTRPETVHVTRHPGLSCLGCWHEMAPYSEGLPGCRRVDVACMRALPVETIWAKLEALMRGDRDADLQGRVERYETRRIEFFARQYSRETQQAISRAYDRRIAAVREELRKRNSLLHRSRRYLRKKVDALLPRR